MATTRETVLRLLDRALADPALLQRLMADPLGVARAEGVQVTTADLKRWLRLPAASDEELLEVLRGRLERLSRAEDRSSPSSAS